MKDSSNQAVVQCPICSKDVPAMSINAHLDNRCSDSVPADATRSDASGSSTKPTKIPEPTSGAKPTKSIHPLFQKKTQDLKDHVSRRVHSNKKRTSTDESSKAVFSNKRPKISATIAEAAPLAERLRPNTLADFVGQPHLTGPESLLMSSMRNGSLGSMIFWGPPGVGKTTLARLLAKQTGSIFKELSATIVGINEVRPVFEEAKNTLRLTGRKTILFLDEVHRFNKAQQDIFLPFLEQGHIQLIGATTENPSFKLTGALLSRCRVFVFERLTDSDMELVIEKAISQVSPPVESHDAEEVEIIDVSSSLQHDSIPGSSQSSYSAPPSSPHFQDTKSDGNPFPSYPQISRRVLASMVSLSAGDARTALSLLELVLAASTNTPENHLIENLRRSVSASYDRSGDSRYDMISALHKSVRGSDVDAAMYWLARMLTAGEDPLYIARRMVVCASEDVGLTDNQALPLAMAALQACQIIGMPECRINLAHIVAYLAEAPKSTRAYEAFNRAQAAAEKDLTLPVPLQVRNAPTRLMKELGYSEGYHYNPDYAHPVHNTYVPPEIEGQKFMRKPGDMSGKIWDEEALAHWESEENDGKTWEGRKERER